jgi:hypothetical protein
VSEALVRIALETRLNAMAGGLTTAWENQDFTPTPDVAYQRAAILPAEPQPLSMTTLVRLSGLLQVTLMYPQSSGPGAAQQQAELLRTWFPRALAMVAGGVVVQVERTPYVMQGSADGDRWALPVRVRYFANIP